MLTASYRVPSSIWTDPDQHGYRRLVHPAGAMVPWDEAVRLGLTTADDIPAEHVEVVVPVSVYEDVVGGRRLVVPAGAHISLAEAHRLGLDVEDPRGAGSGGGTHGPRSRPRTAKKPAPTPGV